MKFPSLQLEHNFPELFGFVLLDPERLEQFCNYQARGQNLVERFTTSEDGDKVAAQGIAIPLMSVDAGYYTIVIRSDEDDLKLVGTPKLSSKGWTLGTLTGALLFCTAGNLITWDPERLDKYQRLVTVPPGFYQVEIRGYTCDGPERKQDGIFEFILTSVNQLPAFTANLHQNFHLFEE